MKEILGFYDILFVGKEEYCKVEILGAMFDIYGHYIYLFGPDDIIYNWSTICILRKNND